MDKKAKIVFMGTPEFAVGSLKALVEGGYDVAGVVTVPDKPSGRGLKINISAVKEFALNHNLPVLQPVSLKDPSFLAELQAIDADCFVVVAFRMLPKAVWSMPRLGTFNLHASLLPQYRGAAPINWAIINGEKESGVTTFLLDSQIDTGRILFQEKCSISPDESIGTLYDRLMSLGSSLVLRTIDALVAGKAVGIPQREGETLHPAPKITRETCKINWSADAISISRLVRGLSPYPAAYAELCFGDKKSDVKIYKTSVAEELPSGDNTPGEIITDGKKYLAVRCADRFLYIEELQVSGKRRLNIKEFLAGVHNFVNVRFE